MSPRVLQMVGFGVFLLCAGVLGWAAAGFTLKAKTALLSGTVCGVSMIGCAWLLARERTWMSAIGSVAGTILPLLFGGVFIWRGIIAWSGWLAGEPKLWVAILLSSMAAVSLGTFWTLCRPWIRRSAETEETAEDAPHIPTSARAVSLPEPQQ